MAYTLNTSHALYPNLVELIGVQSGALVSHKTARTFTKHADASYGSGTYGEHLQTVGAGFTVKGASFTPAVSINTVSSPNGSIVVVVNSITAAAGGGPRNMFGSTVAAAGAYAMGISSAGLITALENWNTTKTTGTADLDAAATPYMLTVTRTGEASHEVYVNTTRDINAATRLAFNTSTGANWDYLGGATGQGSVAEKLVWIAWFDKVLSAAEISDLYASLGASNAFGLIASVGGSVSVETSATVALPVFSGGILVAPAVQLSATAALPVFSGSISFGDTNVEFNFTSLLPVFSGSITVSTGGATISITDLKDLTTGALRVGETGITAIISNLNTGVLVALLTGQTSTAGGDMSLSHASLTSATWYRVTIILADGSEGTWKYQAA